MIDLVYILGSGSIHNNKELMYSLRSVQRFVQDYRNIFIIGDHPGFEGPFTHIPETDNGRNKQDNIRRKLIKACETPEISDPFVMMNDDYFFTKEVTLSDFPYYYHSNLAVVHQGRRKPGHYKRALNNTIVGLGYWGHDIKNFDIHLPIVYYKEIFQMVMRLYNWQEKDGFVIKSLVCNSMKVPGVELKDCNINHPCQSIEEIKEIIGDKFMFSTGDIGLNDVMLQFLHDFYCPVDSELSEKIEN